MRVVIAPQSLKGSLTAAETGEAIAQGVRAVYPEAEIAVVPVADGGEGTVQALVDATGGQMVFQTVTGPLGEPVNAFFGLLGDGRTAAIEMAACAGLPLVPPARRDPRVTTTYGVGELLRAALDHGSRHFIIGIGGSATNDGGAGMAQALGAKLLSEGNQQIARGGAALTTLTPSRWQRWMRVCRNARLMSPAMSITRCAAPWELRRSMDHKRARRLRWWRNSTRRWRTLRRSSHATLEWP